MKAEELNQRLNAGEKNFLEVNLGDMVLKGAILPEGVMQSSV